MPRIDVVVESKISNSSRVRQLEGMFDVPRAETSRLEWHVDLPLDVKPWAVGLIVGPSGSGKSTIARKLYGDRFDAPLAWSASSVLDDFRQGISMSEIAGVCQAVGFNTVPSWMRSYAVLSNGERFRVDLARRMIETEGTIVVDEFTSVVDRQVAKIASHAVQKFVRRNNRQFVAVSCHYDIEDWLQPDWVLDASTCQFRWRLPRRRPGVDIEIARVHHSAWQLFAPYHYMTAELHKGAACYVLFCDGRPAAFAGVLHRPHAHRDNIKGVSRLVTLPDWQGLGLAFVLVDALAAAYKANGHELRTYPAHPALIHAFDRAKFWALAVKPGTFGKRNRSKTISRTSVGTMGGRPNAVFRYVGPAADEGRLVA